jgi:hypothetical protein
VRYERRRRGTEDERIARTAIFPQRRLDDDDVGPVETYGVLGGTAVCGVAWSFADPWSFASLEGDGAVALRVVPRAEKYRILL